MWLPDIKIEITPPKGPFRIHPDAMRTAGQLLCTYENGQWWLAHPDGVLPDQLNPGLWVSLYEGIQADGTGFLMPVFRYARDVELDPHPFLSEAVRLARTRWVEIEYGRDDNCRVVTVRKSLPEPTGWSPYAMADLIDIGFGGRYLGSWRDIAVRLLGNREFIVHVPRSDFFYWMRKQFDPDDIQLDEDRC